MLLGTGLEVARPITNASGLYCWKTRLLDERFCDLGFDPRSWLQRMLDFDFLFLLLFVYFMFSVTFRPFQMQQADLSPGTWPFV